MVSGTTAEEHRLHSDHVLRRTAGRSLSQRPGVTMLSARLRLLGNHKEGDFYIQALAVKKDMRGHGIGSLLMNFIEDYARSRGSKRMCLHVASQYGSARRLYERQGMIFEEGLLEAMHLPHILVRMVKTLI